MTLSSGTILKSRYEIREKLGGGGFGNVYLAEDKLKHCLRAVKETLCDSLEGEDSDKIKEQFRFEAEILVRLSHPHFPEVEDFFEQDDKYYLIMEYIDGEDLERIIEQNPSIPERQILDWAIQLCNVIEYLHSQKPNPVIFRDLKPKNIMLSRKGEIKLIDFGISKLLDKGDKTKSGARAASQHFSPPEQYTSAGTDITSDLYSLGATIYFLLTRYPPVDAIDRLTKTLELAKPSAMNKAVSSELEKIILRAMDMDKKKRFQSVAHLRESLEKLAISYGELPDKITLSGKLIDNTERGNKETGGSKHPLSTASRELADKEKNRDLFKKRLFYASGIMVIFMAFLFIFRPVVTNFAINQATSCYRLDDYPQALKWLKFSRLFGNSDPKIYFAFGQIYLQKKDYSEALREFERLLHFRPDFNEADYLIGRTHFLQGDYEKAEAELKDYLDKHSRDYRASLALADTYVSLHDADRAFTQFISAMELLKYDYTPETYEGWEKKTDRKSYLVDFYCGLGMSYQLSGDYGMALRQYEAAKKIQPENSRISEQAYSIINHIQSSDIPDAALLLGDTYLLLGEYNKAIDEYKDPAVKEKFKSDAYFLMHLGQAHQGIGQIKEAVDYFKRAMEIISKNPDDYKDLTQVVPFRDDFASTRNVVSYQEKTTEESKSNQSSHTAPSISGELQKYNLNSPVGGTPFENMKKVSLPEYKITARKIYSYGNLLADRREEQTIGNLEAELHYYMAEAYMSAGDKVSAIENYNSYLEECPHGIFSDRARNEISKTKVSR